MNVDDVKIGMKVVPHSKLGFVNGLIHSSMFNAAKRINQKYLYVVYKYHKDFFLLNYNNNENDGDYYNSADFEPYLTEERKLKLKKINDGTV